MEQVQIIDEKIEQSYVSQVRFVEQEKKVRIVENINYVLKFACDVRSTRKKFI